MRNKGFFWILTVVLALVCIYQISFTFISNKQEALADEDAIFKVDSTTDAHNADPALGNIATLPNGEVYDLTSEKGLDSAKRFYSDAYLKSIGSEPVYPVLDKTYDEVKNQSINLGLDLRGGMSVTLELSVPHLVKNTVTDNRSPKFKVVFAEAKTAYDNAEGDFVDLFVSKFEAKYPKDDLADLFYEANAGVDREMSNDDVALYLKEVSKEALGGVEKVINKRVNQFGVSQPNITKDPISNRVMVELPGVKDRETVRKRLQSTANLMFFEVFDFGKVAEAVGGLDALNKEYKMFKGLNPDSIYVSADTTKINENELWSILLPNQATQDGQNLIYGKGIFGRVLPRDTAKVGAFLRSPRVNGKLNSVSGGENDLSLMFSASADEFGYLTLHTVKVPADGKAPVGGKAVKKAYQGYEGNKVTVQIQFTGDGTEGWAKLTGDNVNRPVAIVMDNLVYSAPNVLQAMNQGSCFIEGNFTIEEAKGLADLLNGGSLPAPCKIVEESSVGPTLADENINKGLMSFGIALLVILIYMFFYYGKAGLVADVALVANMLFILGALASFKAVLTLAGIAGIVLTIGMSVDANVLIFERIREELANGKGLKNAVGDGYKKALAAILDANITTLLTAIVLKVFGTGPIESFATTLIIGIFTSVFAAIVLTRLLLEISIKKNSELTFSTGITKNWFKNMNYKFVKNRKKFYMISGILVIGGIASLAIRGLDLGLEFTGGRSVLVEFDEKIDNKKISDAFEQVLVVGEEQGTVNVKEKGSSFTAEISSKFLIGQEGSDSLFNAKVDEALVLLEPELGNGKIMKSQTFLPVISKELKSSSFWAILISLIIIFVYILIRFGKWQYGLGALLAMAHDVVLVLSIFSIGYGFFGFSMEMDQAFIAAILTVVGYSINDTVVVFDRIREFIGLNKTKDRKEVINNALNSTLSRTINTSLSTFVVLLMIFIFGGEAIKGFVFALMVGVIVGTYSSLCIATPTVVDLTKSMKLKEGETA